VDYKHGRPRETESGIELWPSDRVQLAIQGLVLRENGYRCEEGIVYYAQTRQRVRIPFDGSAIAETERAKVLSRILASRAFEGTPGGFGGFHDDRLPPWLNLR